jgi:hypothetical protein
LTDAQIIEAVRSGTHVLVPAAGEWTITKIEPPRADAVAVLEINLATNDEARLLADNLWTAAAANGVF